ncbi:MAG TPA: ATP-binding protein, partial [Planctomycetaceae bacterium]|nr:ATP-binding protein [Planctomycetaceae bacterium]
NLRQASQRISTGDFDTPVMAYDEGEFSELADALTEMSLNLKRLQRQLSASEKIAAWQTMGRKMAHEVKNPLSPIAISADDLRRSWVEKQPNFEGILNETTSTIKEEVSRLTKLLDQFVSFARMTPPTIKPSPVRDLIDRIEQLYRNDVNAERLKIEVDSSVRELKPEIDSEQIGQVLINLIKNGLESNDNPVVSLKVKTASDELLLIVSDNGPGFSDEILADSFRPYLSTKPDGSGLGLIICQRIVIDHGGNIELFNEPEGGAGVAITLPIHHG